MIVYLDSLFIMITKESTVKISRREFLKILGQFVAGGGLAAVGGYQCSTRIEPERLVVEQVQVPLHNLKTALEGFKIVQLSDIHLSGHSHDGQVRLPGLGAPILPRYGKKYDQGLNRANDLWVYTNRGLGVIGPPVRFNCPPEVTEITLTGV